jgi:prepilin-type N-terminal cleavage/methylation domain-containing protein
MAEAGPTAGLDGQYLFEKMRKRKGFTLVEVLVSASIFLVVLVTIYSAFHTGVFGYRNIEDRISLYQSARFILERLNLDLRNSFAYSEDDSKFQGSKEEISFLTLVDTFTPEATPREYSLISYRAQGERLLRLCRKNKQSLNEDSGVLPEDMNQGLKELAFEYGYIDPTDKSLKFKDTWAMGRDAESERKGMPAAIKIKLVLKNKTLQDFQRTIYLPVVLE